MTRKRPHPKTCRAPGPTPAPGQGGHVFPAVRQAGHVYAVSRQGGQGGHVYPKSGQGNQVYMPERAGRPRLPKIQAGLPGVHARAGREATSTQSWQGGQVYPLLAGRPCLPTPDRTARCASPGRADRSTRQAPATGSRVQCAPRCLPEWPAERDASSTWLWRHLGTAAGLTGRRAPRRFLGAAEGVAAFRCLQLRHGKSRRHSLASPPGAGTWPSVY